MDINIKEKYWNLFTSKEFNKFRPVGITDKKLEKIKPIIFKWNFFWNDVVSRHCLETIDIKLEIEVFNHAVGNFYGMIFEAMIKTGILK